MGKSKNNTGDVNPTEQLYVLLERIASALEQSTEAIGLHTDAIDELRELADKKLKLGNVLGSLMGRRSTPDDAG